MVGTLNHITCNAYSPKGVETLIHRKCPEKEFNSVFVMILDCKTVVFGCFRKARSAVSMILEWEAREPHMPCGRVRRENDCWLFIQQIRSKQGPYNVTEVTEIAWQLHPHLNFDTLDALFWCKICYVVVEGMKFCSLVQWWFGKDERFCFSVNCRMCPCQKRLKSVKWIKQHRKNRPQVEEESQRSESIGQLQIVCLLF